MIEFAYPFLSLEYSGLIVALVLLGLAGLGILLGPRGPLKAVSWVIGVGALVLTVGAASHLVRLGQVENRFPPPGEFVDLGGYKVHVLAEGPKNGPPIVWFAGGHSAGIGLFDQHKALRGELRTILIDRPGTGWSDAGPFPRTTAREAHEIIKALEAAGEEGPFIFAGHSFGGLLAANIARRYPEQTAAVIMMDATPLDVVVYGADKEGLGSFGKMLRGQGLRRIFGFYTLKFPESLAETNEPSTIDYASPFEVVGFIEADAKAAFTGASIFEELSATGVADRAWDTFIVDGELGDIPLYLFAPKLDPETDVYVETVVGPGEEAERFKDFLYKTRERYMDASNNSKRVVAPDGTGHNFIYQVPEFVTGKIREIHKEVSGSTDEKSDYEKLTTAWPGPYGGLPPVDLARPDNLEAAYVQAVEDNRAEIAAIAANQDPPNFKNTIEALEDSGRALAHIDAIFQIFSSTAGNEDIAAVAARVAPLRPQFEDEIAHNSVLLDRIKAVHAGLPNSAPTPEARRLVEVVYENMRRRGADLADGDKERLSAINARLAELRTEFNINSRNDEASLVVFVDDESELDGLTERQRQSAKTAAEDRERPDAWAFPINRPVVWPLLTNASSRSLREKVWRTWISRGSNPGENDNTPVMTEILKLRGQKAKLLGYPTFAHYQTAGRMAGTPEAALDVMMDTWNALKEPTLEEIAQLQAIANEEGADFEIQAWDKLYYGEKLRQRKFNFDSQSVVPYLSLDNIVSAMLWTAEQAYGFTFHEITGVPVISDDIRVYEVRRGQEVIGVLYNDLFQRPGKGPASWASQYRSAEDFRGRILPVVALHSAVPKPTQGEPVTVPWERANVIFHEFGHTLHMLANGASYPSLGSLAMPWDFIEVPSLLYEQWLLSDEAISRFLRHHETGAPMPDDLVARLRATLKHDRVFSATLNYLAAAIVDMKLHLMADGREINAQEVEQAALEELEMPQAIDLILYVPHAFHTFSQQYAAGVYTYLWSDVIAADIAQAFHDSEGGLYDDDVAAKYYSTIMSMGYRKPTDEAFRDFRGRDPDPKALMRRFDLMPAE